MRWGGGGSILIFACLSRLTIDHASIGDVERLYFQCFSEKRFERGPRADPPTLHPLRILSNSIYIFRILIVYWLVETDPNAVHFFLSSFYCLIYVAAHNESIG